ncbi:hypothetical protein ACJX0J_008419 [Zea mays]
MEHIKMVVMANRDHFHPQLHLCYKKRTIGKLWQHINHSHDIIYSIMDINQKMTIETSTCLFDPLRTDGKEIITISGINFGFQFFKCLCKIIINCEYASEYLQKSATKPLQYVTKVSVESTSFLIAFTNPSHMTI